MTDDQTDPKDVPVSTEPFATDSYTKQQAAPPALTTPRVGTSGGPFLIGAARTIPAVAEGVYNFATSPTAAATGGTAARIATTAAEIGRGIWNMSPADILAATRAGWYAGKGGYWLTKGGQKLAVPVAEALDAVAPYASYLTPLGIVQGAVDLTHMTEPNRKDYGDFFGISTNTPPPDPTHPALLNLAAQKVMDAITQARAAVANGMSSFQAAQAASGGNPTIFGSIMNHFMQSPPAKP